MAPTRSQAFHVVYQGIQIIRLDSESLLCQAFTEAAAAKASVRLDVVQYLTAILKPNRDLVTIRFVLAASANSGGEIMKKCYEFLGLYETSGISSPNFLYWTK